MCVYRKIHFDLYGIEKPETVKIHVYATHVNTWYEGNRMENN